MTDDYRKPSAPRSSAILEEPFRAEITRRAGDVADAVDPFTALRDVTTEIAAEFGADRCSVITPFGRGAARILASSDAEPAEHLFISLERYPELQLVLDSGEAVLVRDVGASEILAPVRDLVLHSKTTSLVTVPLRLPGIIAILRVISIARHFTPSDLDSLTAVAHVIESEMSSAGAVEDVQDRWSRLVGDLADAVLDVAPDTRIVAVEEGAGGPGWQHLCELEGKYLTDVLLDPNHDGISPTVVELMQGREPSSRRSIVVRVPDASPIPVIAVAKLCQRPPFRVRIALRDLHPSRTGTGSPGAGKGPITEASEVHLLDAQIRQQTAEIDSLRQQVEELTSRRTVFLTASAHELKTPLTILQIYVETLLGDLSEGMSEEQLEFIRICHESLLRLRQLVLNLVDLAALEAGGLDLSIESVATRPVLESLVEELLPLASHAGVSLELHHPDDIPVVRADRERVKQVVRNLLDNAIKHTPASGKVVVGARSDDDSVVLTVQDTGIGIPDNRLGDIFDEFVRVGTDQDARDRGSGLGLAVSHRLTSALGGTISVHSREGEGTTFRVRLPQWPADG